MVLNELRQREPEEVKALITLSDQSSEVKISSFLTCEHLYIFAFPRINPSIPNKTEAVEAVELKELEQVVEDVEILTIEKELEVLVKDEAPVIPPVTKKNSPPNVRGPKAAKPPTAKYKKPAKLVDSKEYVDTKAFVVHGIPYHKPHCRHDTQHEEDRNASDHGATLAPGGL
ncbi:hypothetical protein BGX38DRAFT_1269692 [Terfezia claveryi]|nr:hypothetical protein BGX38DRAFT_1269692 [Terfezia claveryi]